MLRLVTSHRRRTERGVDSLTEQAQLVMYLHQRRPTRHGGLAARRVEENLDVAAQSLQAPTGGGQRQRSASGFYAAATPSGDT
ncbi:MULTISPECIES: hypothetical protein [Micromonospora]|uniref:hypothetical protein n=1 Tax=Micromonospora TaxID=1873 RepID=UPI0033C41CF0